MRTAAVVPVVEVVVVVVELAVVVEMVVMVVVLPKFRVVVVVCGDGGHAHLVLESPVLGTD
jgi:hypothetical protein